MTRERCRICQKPPTSYPNWVLSKGFAYHVGCLAQDYEDLQNAHKALVDKAQAAGFWGPWSDDWEGSYDAKHWGD